MNSKIYWIDEKEVGTKQLGIMPRPRGNDWLEDEIKGLKIREVDFLVSLLEYSEVYELGLSKEKELCQKEGIGFINFPIKDVSIPDNKYDFLHLVNQLSLHLKNAKKVVIHCRMGIGRSSLLASALMIKMGGNAENIFEKISTYREIEVPDTEEQKAWIFDLIEEIKKNV